MSSDFQPGQRWVSEAESELGLGSVQQVSDRTVTVFFPASGETRQYALGNPPLRRVRFRAGDRIQLQHGASVSIDSVAERNGLVLYRSGSQEFQESELSDQISFNSPEERLRNAQVDPTAAFDLRAATLQHQHQRRKSP